MSIQTCIHAFVRLRAYTRRVYVSVFNAIVYLPTYLQGCTANSVYHSSLSAVIKYRCLSWGTMQNCVGLSTSNSDSPIILQTLLTIISNCPHAAVCHYRLELHCHKKQKTQFMWKISIFRSAMSCNKIALYTCSHKKNTCYFSKWNGHTTREFTRHGSIWANYESVEITRRGWLWERNERME